MLFLIKNRDYFYDKKEHCSNVFFIADSQKVSFKELAYLIDEKVYLNIFLEDTLHLKFLADYPLGGINIYVLIDNISFIPYHLRIKSEIIMEDKHIYTSYFPELKKFLENKNYIMNIPNYLQRGVLRAFILNIYSSIENKKFLWEAVIEMRNVFFYKDHKTCLQILYIWYNKHNFMVDNNTKVHPSLEL